jgi:hypothetical protein
MTMRVKHGFWIPTDKLTLSATTTLTVSSVPSSVRSALTNPDWRRAMEEEFDVLITNKTWDLIPQPTGSNVITGKWIFKHKFNSDGTLE